MLPKRFSISKSVPFALFLALSLPVISFAVLPESSPEAQFLAQVIRLEHTIKDEPLRWSKLYAASWVYQMTVSPEAATYTGFPGQNTRWSDFSKGAFLARREMNHKLQSLLTKWPSGKLNGEQAISRALFLRDLGESLEAENFPMEYLQIDQMGGIHSRLGDLLQAAPRATKQDYIDRIVRMETFATPVDQSLLWLREGLAKGITPPAVTLRDLATQFDRLMPSQVTDSPLYQVFQKMTLPIEISEKKEIQARAEKALIQVVYPKLKELREFLVHTYIPGCRTSLGLSELPDGKNWYRFMAKVSTTTNLTPEQIHSLGLSEVDRIHTEMEKIKTKIGFEGTLKAFNQKLRTDPAFYFTDANSLLAGYRDIAKRIDPELPRLFGHLPRLTYGVLAIPDFKAPSAPAAYYESGSLKTGRAGYFFANTFELAQRPKWEMQALTLHEAVPGHHLQIAISQELAELPEFRREGGYTAFTEGWGLYAESLGEELGLLQDPIDKYGQLNFEMMRAIRLVVDTGLHSKGWSRDQVVQYFRDNSAVAEQEIQSETDRYIVWPGQALGYKVGQLKLRELRTTAQKTLGDKFSIRDFHDQILGSGALPLDLVQEKIDRWIKSASH